MVFGLIGDISHTVLYDPVWTLFPGSRGGFEVLLSLGFIVFALILLRIDRRTAWPVLVVYIFAVLYFTMLSRTPGAERKALTVPFQTIRNAVDWRNGWFMVVNRMNLFELMANVLLFMPLGCLLPTLFRFARHWFVAVPLGFLGSLAIEVTQYYTRLGCFDVDDLIANTLGAAAGFLVFLLVLKRSVK